MHTSSHNDPRTMRRRSSSICAIHEFPNLTLPTSERHALGGIVQTEPKLPAPLPKNRFRNNPEVVEQKQAEAEFSPISEDAKGFFYVTIVNLGFLFDASER